MDFVAAAALEADRIMDNIPTHLRKVTTTQTNILTNNKTNIVTSKDTTTPKKINYRAQLERVVEASKALLAVSNPQDLDLQLLHQHPGQAASLHRALVAIVAWSLDVFGLLQDDDTYNEYITNDKSAQENKESTKSLTHSAMSTTMELEMRAYQLDLPLHLPLYQGLLTEMPLQYKQIGQHIEATYGVTALRTVLQNVIVEAWLPGCIKYGKLSIALQLIWGCMRMYNDIIRIWDKKWSLEMLLYVKEIVKGCAQTTPSSENKLAIPGASAAAAIVKLLEPTFIETVVFQESRDELKCMGTVLRSKREAETQQQLEYNDNDITMQLIDVSTTAGYFVDMQAESILLFHIKISSVKSMIMQWFTEHREKKVLEGQVTHGDCDSDSGTDSDSDNEATLPVGLSGRELQSLSEYMRILQDMEESGLGESEDLLVLTDVYHHTQPEFPDVSFQCRALDFDKDEEAWRIEQSLDHYPLRYSREMADVLDRRMFPELVEARKALREQRDRVLFNQDVSEWASEDDCSDDDDSDDE